MVPLSRSLRNAYDGHLKSMSERLGIHSFFVSCFESALDVREAVVYGLASDPYPVAVDDATARFHAGTRSEFRRVSSLGEERTILMDFIGRLEPSDVIWDVGANIGTHTCLAADVLHDGNVVAFEPTPVNREALERNVRLNGLENVVVRSCALGAAAGTASLSMPVNEPGFGAHSLTDDTGVETIAVDVCRGDDAVEDLPAPMVVKIDVEGAELDVIEGAMGVLSADRCRLVYVEVHEGVDRSAVADRLAACEFAVETLQERGTELIVRGIR